MSAALVVAWLMLSSCGADEAADRSLGGDPSDGPAPRGGSGLPSQLVGQWEVQGVDVKPGTVLTLAAGEARVFLRCGLIYGSWDALPGGTFIAQTWGRSGDCGSDARPPEEPTWLTRAFAFVVSGPDRELLGQDGRVTATLRAATARPQAPQSAIASVTQPPVLTAADRERLDRRPPSFPAGVRPAEAAELVGTWVLPGEDGAGRNWPHATFGSDGTWFGSDGCNGQGGRWALAAGALLTGSGIQTAIGCENIAVLSGAVLAAFDGETLVLIGEQGQEIRRAVRGPAPKAS